MKPFILKSSDHISNIRSAISIYRFAGIYAKEDKVASSFSDRNSGVTLNIAKDNNKVHFQLKSGESELFSFSMSGTSSDPTFEFSHDGPAPDISKEMNSLYEKYNKRELNVQESLTL